VEVAYFRSIYKARLDGLRGTNVLFGRNDSGKSNVLRALNQFFNNETNPGLRFDFDRDFCHARLAEADPARNIRKFVYVKLWIATPVSWQASLGEEFWVKKQWSTTRESDPHLDSSIGERRLQQYLTRFLNRVRFHYVPAIKDRRIFEHLLGEIYKVIASHEAFPESLSDFTTALRERTGDLTAGLLDDLGVNSVISPPDDLTDLFRSLDFETSIEQGDSYSLTLQRGDGIQVRHIPAILAFLTDRSPEDYHIWGFEEPENSLELANAIEEARLFCQYGEAANKQIFITSHSPAFFALNDPKVARFFVSRSEQHDGRLASKLQTISPDDENAPGELMGETPHLPVISSYLREAHARIETLRGVGNELAMRLQQRDISLLGRTVLVVVDNDAAGRALYKNGRLDRGGRWVEHNSNGVHWCRLPFPEHFRRFMNSTRIAKSHWPGTLENLFTPTLRAEAEQDGALSLTATPHDELLNSASYPRIEAYLPPANAPERYYVLRIDDHSKMPFAQWIAERAQLDRGILEPLRPVVEGIHNILIGPLPEAGGGAQDLDEP
jgi:predicted ATPase